MHRWADFLMNIFVNFRQKLKSSQGTTSKGSRRSFLMKKTNTQKSRDTVPLNICIFWLIWPWILARTWQQRSPKRGENTETINLGTFPLNMRRNIRAHGTEATCCTASNLQTEFQLVNKFLNQIHKIKSGTHVELKGTVAWDFLKSVFFHESIVYCP